MVKTNKVYDISHKLYEKFITFPRKSIENVLGGIWKLKEDI